jgi:amidophosphoribosyltransferase
MDFPSRNELIAATHSLEEITKYLRVDSLAYLSVEGLMKAVEGTPRDIARRVSPRITR